MDDYYPNISPIRTGLACKCPRCGGGKLFSGFLTVRETGDVCGLDLRGPDSSEEGGVGKEERAGGGLSQYEEKNVVLKE